MDWKPLQAFGAILAFFHLSEFTLAWRYMRDDFSAKSLLLSKPYCLAMALACLEYILEAIYTPFVKIQFISVCGLVMVVCGEIIRKVAMVTAGHNFTHTLQQQKRRGHVLVTDGIYRYVRHPGYLGWFFWAIGTQLVLMNPICTVGFALAAWRFFADRISVEERHLRLFFSEYEEYAQQTPTWIPLVR